MANTTNRQLPLPANTDLISLGDDAIRDISTKLDSAATLLVGAFTGRPATPPVGTFYWAEDTTTLYVYAGTWVEVSASQPIGTVSAYAGASAPSDSRFLVCEGQAVSRTTYARLFTVLGGTSSPYGAGNGTTTFNVPDLRGRVAVGSGTGTGLTTRTIGARSGAETHQLTFQELARHAHGWRASNGVPSGVGYDGRIISAGENTANTYTTGSAFVPTENYTGGDVPHNNMQPYLVTRYVIRAL